MSANQAQSTFIAFPNKPDNTSNEITTLLSKKSPPISSNCEKLDITLRNEFGREMCITGDMTSIQLLSLPTLLSDAEVKTHDSIKPPDTDFSRNTTI